MKISSLKFLLTSLLAVTLLSACDASPVKQARSGNKDDAYIEEPLSESERQYQLHHAKSNAYVGLLSQKDYGAIYEEFSPAIKSSVPPESIKSIYDVILASYGAPVETKQMQWWFITATEKGIPIIISRKLVKHEKAMLEYDFTFSPDDKDAKLIGFFIRERKGNF